MKKITFTIACIILVTAISGLCHARVTGECSNCHTMHNSQGGQPMAWEFSGGSFPSRATPYGQLLKSNCIGCHTATDSSTWKSSIGAPIVYNTSQPGYGDSQPDDKHVGLAAGNFYWTTEGSGESRGHSGISGIPYADDISTPSTKHRTACGTKECHTALSAKGCESCHLPAHHKHGTTTTIVDEEDGYYRFLGPISEAQGGSSQHKWGVRGYEDTDWQKTYGWSDHNEYSGEDQQTGGGYQSISRHCGCHYPTWSGWCNFFWTRVPPWPPDVEGGNYHKATTVLPISGTTWTGYDIDSSGTSPDFYDPMLPIARFVPYDSPSSIVKQGSGSKDTLMCLTCHRAHASPYNKMLRWKYVGSSWDDLPLKSCKGCHRL